MSSRDREDLREAARDATIERAWRDGSAEQPAARVDAAIIAAAHEAVADRKRIPVATPARVRPRQRWNRWARMAAAASVAGLAFMLVQTLPRDPERAPTPDVQQSTKAAAAPTAVPAAPSSIQSTPAAIPAENAAAGIASASQVPSVGSNESRSDAGAKRGVVADSTAAGAAASPEEWVSRILALHDSGDVTAAADALRAFRATEPHADRYLPAQIREWAGTVQ